MAATSRLSEVEVASAIVRRAREGSFSADQRDRMLNALDDDLPALAIVEVIPAVAADARFLLLRHALRPGDAIQLASCLYLQRQLGRPIPFVVYDRRVALSSLDAITRGDLQNLTLNLCAEQNLTLVIVTHAIEEAVALGEKILLLGEAPNRRPRIF